MAVIDPWGGYNQGLQNLGQTFTDIQGLQRQKKMDDASLRHLALQEQVQSANLGELQAQQGATQQAYGGPDLQTAYANKMKEEIQAKRVEAYFNHLGMLEKSGASPEFITEIGKADLAKVPEYAQAVPNIKFISKDKIVSILEVKPGQIVPNPLTGEPLPPGTYEAEGKATGDWKNPYALTTIKPYEAKESAETWGEPYETSIGGKKAMVQKSSRGKIKPVIQDISTTIKVSPASDFRMDDSNRKYSASLRKEFNNLPEIKESNSIMPKITSMHKALEESRRTNNFVAVDQALITLYNKLTDPSSVVRESEYARTAANIPLLNAVKGKAQKIMTGGAGLTQAERNALVQMADLMKKGYDDIRKNRVEEYHGYARTAGVDPQTVIDDTRRNKASDQSSTPQIAPAGVKAKLKDGRIVTSDGKGGWK